jgi:hypothetical protein
VGAGGAERREAQARVSRAAVARRRRARRGPGGRSSAQAGGTRGRRWRWRGALVACGCGEHARQTLKRAKWSAAQRKSESEPARLLGRSRARGSGAGTRADRAGATLEQTWRERELGSAAPDGISEASGGRADASEQALWHTLIRWGARRA